MAWNTGPNSPGEELTTLSTSEVAVCCSRDSARSPVRWRSSLSSRAFSMAMTACAAKFCSSDLLVCKRLHLLSVDRDCTHQDIVLKQGHGNERPSPGYFDNGNASRIAF